MEKSLKTWKSPPRPLKSARTFYLVPLFPGRYYYAQIRRYRPVPTETEFRYVMVAARAHNPQAFFEVCAVCYRRVRGGGWYCEYCHCFVHPTCARTEEFPKKPWRTRCYNCEDPD